MKEYSYITICLGELKQAQARKAALLAWAKELNLTWGGKPSVGRLVQWLADERIATGTSENCQGEN